MNARRFADFALAVAKRFMADACLVRASALAYASLLSIVPLFAVMFSVLKGLGVQARLEPLLLSRLSLSPDTTHAIINYIDRTNVTTLGTLGAATLVFSVISVLGSVEGSFNYIWRVSHNRTIWRKVTDYVSVVMLTPFLLLAAGAITSSLRAQHMLHLAAQSEFVGSAVGQMLRVAPALINAAAIGVLYAVMPNRRPSARPVVVSALVAGVAWYVVQWLYVSLQIGAARYNAIYGALSQLPVTLVWMYFSWVIVLAGAELAAVIEFGTEISPSISWNPAAVTLQILVRVADRFSGKGVSVSLRHIAREMKVPIDAIRTALEDLERRGWIVAVEGAAPQFILARDPEQIDLTVLSELSQLGKLPHGCDPRVAHVLADVSQRTESAWSQWRLTDVLAGSAKDSR